MNTYSPAAMPAASPFGRRTSFATAYRQIGVSTDVSEASAHKLVTMLYDGFVDALTEARGHIRERRHEAKGRAIGRAMSIVDDGLKAGLDLRAGGALAVNLDGLYDYVLLQLSRASLANDERLLDECQNLIEPLRSAWKGIAAQVAASPYAGAAK